MNTTYTVGQDISIKGRNGEILTFVVQEVNVDGYPVILAMKEVPKELPDLIFRVPLILNGIDNTQEPTIAQLVAIAHDLYIYGYDTNIRLIGKGGKWWFQMTDDELLVDFYSNDYIANRWLDGPFTHNDLNGILALSKEDAHHKRYEAVLADKAYKMPQINTAYKSFHQAQQARMGW